VSATSNATWSQLSMPYVLNQSYFTVAAGVRLTLAPGVVFKLQRYYYGAYGYVQMDGTLVAQGTPTQKIVFTSLKDDSIGGDTNGDGTSAAAMNDWNYLLLGGTGSVLSNVVMRYSAQGVYAVGGSPSITDSTFSNNGYAVYATGSGAGGTISGNAMTSNGVGIACGSGAAPLIHNNDIVGNQYGLSNGDSSLTINAQNNYWGAPDGPSGAGSGSGDKVSAYVSYIPFLGSSGIILPPSQPVIAVSPTAIDFGQVPVDTTATYSVAITNEAPPHSL
jgi:parallel beta-helix repeat protein